MQIRHERPISDLSFRVRAPLTLTLANSKKVKVEDWSLTSVTYPEATDILPKSAELSIPFQGVEIQFPVRFTQGSRPGELVFDGLTGRHRETLAVFYRSILSGKMASTEDIITSLDTPVDLVPMGETVEERTEGTKGQNPRSLRVIRNVLLNAFLALFVFGVIGSQIWNRLTHINLNHARVVAPLSEHRNSSAAYVDRILVAPGDLVRRGQTLVRLNQPGANAALEDIREDVAAGKEKVRVARKKYQAHLAREAQHKETLEVTYRNAVAKHPFADFLRGSPTEDVDAAWQALQAFDTGTSQVANDFDEVRESLLDVLNDRKSELSRLKRDLGNQKAATRAADIIATVDGTVSDINVFRDQHIPRGTNVLVLEENSERIARAWVPEKLANAVYVGMETTVRFNSGEGTRSVPGIITQTRATLDPTISSEFGIIVTISFTGMTAAKTRDLFRSDAPLVIRAIKPWSFP